MNFLSLRIAPLLVQSTVLLDRNRCNHHLNPTHDLRHFTATQLIHAGKDIRTVADFLGHSDPSLTLRVYSHAIEERTRATVTIMGQVLAARKEPAKLTSGA